jgi:hypothetical protein
MFSTARSILRFLLVTLAVGCATSGEAAALEVASVRRVPVDVVAQYAKLEISFQVTGSAATRMQWPYDPAPPNGIPAGAGITVNAIFTDPNGQQFVQPAFYAEDFLDAVREGRDWHLPTGTFTWRVRFSPNRPGQWTYRIVATDRTGTAQTSSFAFAVAPSAHRGFVRVSAADSRYFEFDDGTLFDGVGFLLPSYIDAPVTTGAAEYAKLAAARVNFVRVWISSIFGSAWSTWIGGRNQYRGYLPVTGLVPYTDTGTGQTTLAMMLDHEPAGDTGWFDACRMQLWWEDQAESIKPNTTYRIRVEYHAASMAGPRNASSPNYGLVAKLGDGGWYPDCHEPGKGTPVTAYGANNTGFGYVDGTWNSGNNSFLPRMHLALENVQQGWAVIRSVSLREQLADGALGPEMMIQPSMERELYIPEEKAYSLDRIVELAERNGVYLKLVLMDKSDKIYFKMADDGSWATSDNEDGFYGLGRGMNKTRWLQQMWWRYLQARWGYSPNIHSWELTNEGDPASTAHYELTDELGKYMHCRAFGVDPGSGDGAACGLRHPNAHLVTTSVWHSFPASELWSNAKYPNVDYADLHAYISTSYAAYTDRQLMQWDAAYYHTWHSQNTSDFRVGKPIVRGEGGMDSPDQQSETVLGLERDTSGVWLHNFLWSGLDRGGLYELYWWTSHIWGSTFDHRAAYSAVRTFLGDTPMNKGGYRDWGGSVSNATLRVVGQKNVAAGSSHLWVQNKQHTWKNVVDRVAISPASGEVVVPGFTAGASYALERWDTYVPGGRITATETLSADADGNLRIAVNALTTDVALKVRPNSAGSPRSPASVTIVKP